MSHKKQRLPFQPLAEYARLRYRAPDENVDQMAGPPAWVDQLLSYRWPRNTISTWQHRGVPLDQAEDIAAEMGHHPTYIWPEYGRDIAA